MKELRLTPRLLRIAALVPEGRVVADIGTDHAYLPVYLVATGRCPRAIASDRRPGPLAAARATVAAFGLEGRVDLRLGDGLSVLAPGEVEAAVLAGMGGLTITRILARDLSLSASLERLVCQPMTAVAGVRRWLLSHGFRLAHEDLVREGGAFYEILAAEPGRESLDDEVLYEVGPRLWEQRHPLLVPFLRYRLQECRRTLDKIDARGPRGARAYAETLGRARALAAVLAALGAPEPGP